MRRRETRCWEWRKDDFQNVIYQRRERQSPGTWFRWQWDLSITVSNTDSRCQLSNSGAVVNSNRKTTPVSYLSRQNTSIPNKKERLYVNVSVKDFSVCADVCLAIFLFIHRDFVLTERAEFGSWSSSEIIIRELDGLCQTENSAWIETCHSTDTKQHRFSC